jgi:hypothetical protein
MQRSVSIPAVPPDIIEPVCMERRARVIEFWMAFSSVLIIAGRSSERHGFATVGRADLSADRNLFAQPLIYAGFASARKAQQ